MFNNIAITLYDEGIYVVYPPAPNYIDLDTNIQINILTNLIKYKNNSKTSILSTKKEVKLITP